MFWIFFLILFKHHVYGYKQHFCLKKIKNKNRKLLRSTKFTPFLLAMKLFFILYFFHWAKKTSFVFQFSVTFLFSYNKKNGFFHCFHCFFFFCTRTLWISIKNATSISLRRNCISNSFIFTSNLKWKYKN